MWVARTAIRQLSCHSLTRLCIAANGLGVIGGDTTNFVGLGGCKPEDWISADMPNYCARGVLQSPTMWLGIFAGGCGVISPFPVGGTHDALADF